jgi:methylmalonyl-CoA/ethylmalonyl-CoA epimerase
LTRDGDESGSPPFGRFHHAGIVVAHETHDDVVNALAKLLMGTVTDGGTDDPLDIRWTFLSSPNNPIIEVASPRGVKESPISRFLEATGGGVHHLSFETNDIDRCFRHTTEVDLPVVGRQDDHGGWAELFVAPSALGGAIILAMEDRRGQG